MAQSTNFKLEYLYFVCFNFYPSRLCSWLLINRLLVKHQLTIQNLNLSQLYFMILDLSIDWFYFSNCLHSNFSHTYAKSIACQETSCLRDFLICLMYVNLESLRLHLLKDSSSLRLYSMPSIQKTWSTKTFSCPTLTHHDFHYPKTFGTSFAWRLLVSRTPLA